LYITASIGISLFPKDGLDSMDLLKKADIAMYRGKEQGRNTYQYYSDAGNTGAMQRLVLEKDLRHALKGQRLELLFQPQLSLHDSSVFGTEALIRWLHPDHGPVEPQTFVRLAEETGLINALGEWALRTACEQARTWREQGLPIVPMSVNLSPRQFLQRGFGDRIAGILAETGIEPDALKLEITEGLFMQDTDRIMDILRKLKHLGIGFAIDDFGTGYSSLSYLKRLPIDQIKIDKSFVRDITTDPDDAAIVRAVIAMAHGLKLDVVAEGAETLEQYQFLKAQSCDALQGYYFSRPLSAEDMAGLLARSLDPGAQTKAS
jgi:EAL domain-containing protein (putative c-di-GMP-specific phosphodiesterase class I)